MTENGIDSQFNASNRDIQSPPGRLKIMDALRTLLAQKEFSSITIAEISRTAGVTDALIYKYFADKRDLLHQVLAEYLMVFFEKAEQDLNDISGSLNKLRKLIWTHLTVYSSNRVFARILLLEVRNYPDYFTSEAYQLVRRYAKWIAGLIAEGIRSGEIRRDIKPEVLRQVLIGAIEHSCLSAVIFDKNINADEIADQICTIIFRGIADQGIPE
jgi:TetR/AcrR family transcriptional regulator, fatty acid metabolism regulator protein